MGHHKQVLKRKRLIQSKYPINEIYTRSTCCIYREPLGSTPAAEDEIKKVC